MCISDLQQPGGFRCWLGLNNLPQPRANVNRNGELVENLAGLELREGELNTTRCDKSYAPKNYCGMGFFFCMFLFLGDLVSYLCRCQLLCARCCHQPLQNDCSEEAELGHAIPVISAFVATSTE